MEDHTDTPNSVLSDVSGSYVILVLFTHCNNPETVLCGRSSRESFGTLTQDFVGLFQDLFRKEKGRRYDFCPDVV